MHHKNDVKVNIANRKAAIVVSVARIQIFAVIHNCRIKCR